MATTAPPRGSPDERSILPGLRGLLGDHFFEQRDGRVPPSYMCHLTYDTQGDQSAAGTTPITTTLNGVTTANTPVTTTYQYDGDGNAMTSTMPNSTPSRIRTTPRCYAMLSTAWAAGCVTISKRRMIR